MESIQNCKCKVQKSELSRGNIRGQPDEWFRDKAGSIAQARVPKRVGSFAVWRRSVPSYGGRTIKPFGEINRVAHCYLAGIDLVGPDLEMREVGLAVDRCESPIHRIRADTQARELLLPE